MILTTQAFFQGKEVEGSFVRPLTKYDGYRLDHMELNTTIRTIKDIDDLIYFLKIHRDCFHIAHKNNSDRPDATQPKQIES